ncbi:MAG TPA: hypothetical protein VLY45_03735, partial [Nitrospiria bacterium]|nr:hypothetical protein [Nitrospiria bacterium]
TPVDCKTCHDVHNQGKQFLAAASVTSTGNQSATFNTCTTCHQLNKTDGTVLTDAYHDPSVNSHSSLDEVITDTHAAVPGDTRLNSGSAAVALIFVNKGDDRSCTGCHNPHAADTTINKQWVRSAHGDTTADPWTHYDWKGVSRQPCQQCHTSTGFKNFADALRAGTVYDPTQNNFYGLLAGTTGNTGQLETIYCWGCHTDNKGGLRNPGPITAPYKDMSNNTITFPDVSGSNVCMACHTGQQSGGTVYNTAGDFSNLSFINSHYLTGGATIFRASGYAYLFNSDGSGTGRDYANVSFYAHDQIGSSNAPGTGTNGPCAGCHMQTAEPHLFLPVTKDETTGAVTAITSTACVTCHVPGGQFEMTVAELEQEKTRFASSLKALQDQLEIRSYYFSSVYPYFYQLRYNTGTVSVTNGSAVVTGSGTTWTGAGIATGGASPDQFKVSLDGTYYSVLSVDSDTQLTLTAPYNGSTATGGAYAIIKNGAANAMKNWLTQSGPAPFATPDTDTTGATSGKNNMGAAFNYNLLLHDPGAFAHNRFYIKRLIYDSIDWLDDNNLNDSVQATLSGLDPATHPYQADAIAYLLSSTGGRP